MSPSDDIPAEVRALAERYAGRMADTLLGQGDDPDFIAILANAIMADRRARSSLMDVAVEALQLVPKIASEAAEEWDKAPSGMRAGKIILALAGEVPGYRADTDKVAAALQAISASRNTGGDDV